jgi:hypothetical protein
MINEKEIGLSIAVAFLVTAVLNVMGFFNN